MQILVCYARSLGRLLLIVWITQHQVLKLLLQCALFTRTPELSARHARKWASRIVHAAGIKIECHGDIPSCSSLLTANHRSYIDIVAILSQMPCSFLAKVELLKWPVFGPAAKQGGTIFVDRDSAGSRFESRSQIAAVLARGVSVVVFPEGTTSAGPGLLEFRKGVFHIAAEKTFRVTPVMILYDDPSAAWVGTATFVPHFLTVFGQPEIRMKLFFGPQIIGNDPEVLRETVYHWIADKLVKFEDGRLQLDAHV